MFEYTLLITDKEIDLRELGFYPIDSYTIYRKNKIAIKDLFCVEVKVPMLPMRGIKFCGRRPNTIIVEKPKGIDELKYDKWINSNVKCCGSRDCQYYFSGKEKVDD